MTAVCVIDDLIPDRGVCALVGDRHVAIFKLSGTGDVHAIGNVDPFANASVLSRGLVGSVELDGEWVPYVASPLRKQRFDLRTGRCLDDDAVAVDAYSVQVVGGRVEVCPADSGPPTPGSSWGNGQETDS